MINWKKYYNNFVTITSIHAAAFMAYRLYVHYRQNRLNYLTSDDFKEKDLLPFKTFNFSSHPEHLALIHWEEINDALGAAKAAFFEYKGIIFTLTHYGTDKDNHYTLWIDVESCKKDKKNPNDIAEKFIEAIGFKSVPVTWFNKDWETIYNDYKNKY